jgi:exosome complex component RRP42
MNNEYRQHLIDALLKGIRTDSRAIEDYRKITIERGVSKTAEGSARVRFGETEVIAGVKFEVSKPFSDRPEEGAIMVNAELLSMSNPEFEPGPPGDDAIELARVTDRGIRESKAIDLKQLIIKKGEKCWMIVVDICTLNDDGNLLDASSLAAFAALQDARFPKYENDELDYRTKSDRRIALAKTPIAVTVYKIGPLFLIDPTLEEQKQFDARLTLTSTEDGTICALQKGGEAALSTDDLKKMIEMSIDKGRFLRSLL